MTTVSYQPNLPPLFEDDDWLWVAQSLGYVRFAGEDDEKFASRHRMDRIIAKILEYRAEDVRKAALPAPDWRRELGIKGTGQLTLAQAESAYKLMMRAAHPDHGGTEEWAARVNAAIEAARKELRL